MADWDRIQKPKIATPTRWRECTFRPPAVVTCTATTTHEHPRWLPRWWLDGGKSRRPFLENCAIQAQKKGQKPPNNPHLGAPAVPPKPPRPTSAIPTPSPTPYPALCKVPSSTRGHQNCCHPHVHQAVHQTPRALDQSKTPAASHPTHGDWHIKTP